MERVRAEINELQQKKGLLDAQFPSGNIFIAKEPKID
jgi:hypothetical protein